MKNNIDNLSVKEIEQITHNLLCRDLGIKMLKFKKPNLSIWEELGVKELK